MLKHPKAKGTRLENEVVKEFKERGKHAERCWGSDGRSRGLLKEVDIVVYDLCIELNHDNCQPACLPYLIQCKSVKKLAEKYRLPDKIDAVVFKENFGEKYILLKLEDFLRRL